MAKRRKTRRGDPAQALTQKRIDRLFGEAARNGRPVRTRDGDTKGLYLEVRSKTNAFWVFRFARDGAERWMGLGPYPTLKLPEAREEARLARQKLLKGIDPLSAAQQAKSEKRKEAARAKTFKQAAQEYYDEFSDEWSNDKHRQQFVSTMRDYVYPWIGDRIIEDIDKHDIQDLLRKPHKSGKPLWEAVPETARRVRGRIEKVFSYAKGRGWRTGDNPAMWADNLSVTLKSNRPKKGAAKQHFAALPYAEVPAFMADLAKKEGVSALALRFTILTAVRTSETLDATWAEIDLKEKVWTIPGPRMKNRLQFRVPLSDEAIAILKKLPRLKDCPYVFPASRTGQPMSNMAMLTLIGRMGLKGRTTTHGFRSSFQTWAGDRGYPRDVCEKALAHKEESETVEAYLRTDFLERRRPIMAAWADYVCAPPVKGAKVVPIREAV